MKIHFLFFLAVFSATLSCFAQEHRNLYFCRGMNADGANKLLQVSILYVFSNNGGSIIMQRRQFAKIAATAGAAAITMGSRAFGAEAKDLSDGKPFKAQDYMVLY